MKSRIEISQYTIPEISKFVCNLYKKYSISDIGIKSLGSKTYLMFSFFSLPLGSHILPSISPYPMMRQQERRN